MSFWQHYLCPNKSLDMDSGYAEQQALGPFPWVVPDPALGGRHHFSIFNQADKQLPLLASSSSDPYGWFLPWHVDPHHYSLEHNAVPSSSEASAPSSMGEEASFLVLSTQIFSLLICHNLRPSNLLTQVRNPSLLLLQDPFSCFPTDITGSEDSVTVGPFLHF